MARLCFVVACVKLAPADTPIATESSPNACTPGPIATAFPTLTGFLAILFTPVATEFLPIAIELVSVACAPVPKAIASAPSDLAIRPMAVLRSPEAIVLVLLASPKRSLPPTAMENSPEACVQLPRAVAPRFFASARPPYALVHSCEAMVSEPIEIAFAAFALLA